ncbi:polysaccharide deacetylase family protein [Rhodococcus sp. O3]|uniref:polysaccharide deacetylase family protein n=1 Tax=Rhodococcus sp. O3 TaxID=3404919 RepID=UPI003B66EE8B
MPITNTYSQPTVPTTPSVATTGETPAHTFDASRYLGLEPQQWGTDLAGIESSVAPASDGRRTMALTFDACGGPSGSNIDTHLIDTLVEYQVPATVFLNERWVRANPGATEQLVAHPLLRIENHGTLHVPLSVSGRAAYGIAGTVDAEAVIEEIESNRQTLRSVGVDSRWFRAGTAHYDDVAVSIARDLGVRLAGFATNADFGATATSDAVARQILAAPDGGIVLAHMNQPSSGTAAGLRRALDALTGQGVQFVHLDDDTS